MSKNIMVHHLARCGSHAIIDWIMRSIVKNERARVKHYNNVNQRLEPRGVDVSWVGFGPPSEYDMNIFSTENFDLRGYQGTFREVDFDRTIFIVRDYHHWLASSLKVGGFLGGPTKTRKYQVMKDLGYSKWFCSSMSRLEMYKQYLREFLNYTDYINGKVIVIDFDRWVRSLSYRDYLPVGDVDVSDRPSFHCGGSSFDSGSVTDRYHRMKEEVDPLIDDEISTLYAEYLDSVNVNS